MEQSKFPFAKSSDQLKLNLQHFAQRAGDDEIMFGLADIIIGNGADIIKFDGKNDDERSYLQVEGGSVTFEPTLEDIKFADHGDNAYDQRVIGYEISVTVIAGQETIDMLKLAIAGTENVIEGEGEGANVTGVTDSPLGASNRKRGKPMRIHPRFAGTDHSRDINIYKVATNSEVERAFGNEQGSFEMTFIAYARDGADANKPGNYFYTGAVDPNGQLPTWDELLSPPGVSGSEGNTPSEPTEPETPVTEPEVPADDTTTNPETNPETTTE